MIGRIFNGIKVLKEADELKYGFQRVYNCVCKCGNKLQLTKNQLLNNKNNCKNCKPKKVKIKEISTYNEDIHKNKIGMKFDMLTIIGLGKRDKNNLMLYECQCECGNIKWYRFEDLKKLKSPKSCGCSRVYDFSNRKKDNRVFIKEIKSRYNGIKQRCYVENCKSYKWYGAKGVTMCDEWLNDFDKFYDWCIENGFKKELHIDKDELCIKNGIEPHIYSPETCRFITLAENNGNQSSNYKIEYEGEIYNLEVLSKKLNINRDTLKRRYEEKRDLLNGKDLTDYSIYYTLKDLADIFGYSYMYIRSVVIDINYDKFIYIKNKKLLHKDYFDEFSNIIKINKSRDVNKLYIK
jgi:hypothetical protein